MKKIIALLLALIMTFSVATVAFATVLNFQRKGGIFKCRNL